jgi:hypothetical protein
VGKFHQEKHVRHMQLLGWKEKNTDHNPTESVSDLLCTVDKYRSQF